MKGVVAEDTVRRALKAIDETLGREWLSRHLGRTVLGLLEAPWIAFELTQYVVIGYCLPRP
jgi:hypothetical protein